MNEVYRNLKSSSCHNPGIDSCREYIIDILSQWETRVSPGELIKKLSQKVNISHGAAKQVIKELTNQGEIAYTYFFGSTYMELSFLKPVHITEHFTLTPRSYENRADENAEDSSYANTNIEIIIDPGISFGSGRHPTTKLCIEAMEQVFFKQKILNTEKNFKALDIGTGSGILAIAAVKAGMTECLAIDTDPNAVFEAKRNIKLNGLEEVIKVTGKEIHDKQYGIFSLICANLRFPTLKTLLPLFSLISSDSSVLILSGIRIWETDKLIDFYSCKDFKCLWRKDKKNWSGIILHS